MNYYVEVWKKALDFGGRARRAEYWYFVLFNVLISIVLGIVDGMVGLKTEQGVGMLGALYSVAILIPSIAVGVRRLHDTGKTGWLLLVAFIPCIGAFILLYFFIQDSQPGPNQYGPNPKGL